jgi:hypothetical protein
LIEETLRSSQSPPVAASKARETESSSKRKEARPKVATIMKCPDLAEGCTVDLREFQTLFAKP